MNDFLDSLMSGLPNVLAAIVFLIIALIVAAIARKIVVNLGKRLGLGKLLSKFGLTGDGKEAEIFNLIGKIVYLLVFILFLPGILNRLNLQGVSDPLISMSTSIIGYLPNIIGFVVILVVGIYIAKIIRDIIQALLQKINVNKISQKSGVSLSQNFSKIASLIANIIYAFIMIIVVIAALEVLNISAITDPSVIMLESIFSIIPNVIVAIILIVLGIYIAKIISNLLADVLETAGVNKWLSKIFNDKDGKYEKYSLSKIISNIVRYVIILFFVVEAISVLGLDVLHNIGTAIIGYLPALLSAIIIMGIAFFLAQWVSSLIKKSKTGSAFAANIAYIAVMVAAVFMTLNQLGVATFIVNAAFIIILSALAIAFAIAFGIGGRSFAAKLLDKVDLEKKDHK